MYCKTSAFCTPFFSILAVISYEYGHLGVHHSCSEMRFPASSQAFGSLTFNPVCCLGAMIFALDRLETATMTKIATNPKTRRSPASTANNSMRFTRYLLSLLIGTTPFLVGLTRCFSAVQRVVTISLTLGLVALPSGRPLLA